MVSRLTDRSPTARCWRCGSPEIHAVCHHCGRPMCATDSRTTRRNPRRAGTNRTGREFPQSLALDQAAPPLHCAEHAHLVGPRPLWAIPAGALLVVVGALVMPAAVALGVILLLAGLGLGAGGWWADRRRTGALRAGRPPLPIVPVIDTVRVHETLTGTLELDAGGNYFTEATSVSGELIVATTLGRNDRTRLADYRRIYQVADGEDIEFSGGYLVLRGPMGLRFRNGGSAGPALALTGKVSEIPFLSPTDGRPTGQWRVRRQYELTDWDTVTELPIWLTPSIRAGSDRRNLELDLQWVDFLPEGVPLEVLSIAKLTLIVPTDWGPAEVAGHAEQATVGKAGGFVGFHHLELDDTQRARRRVRLSIRFANRITPVDTISGQLEVLLRNTLSGITGIAVHHPLGHRRPLGDQQVDRKLTLCASFELSLASIRYEQSRQVPDPDRAGDDDKRDTVRFPGVLPDFETVLALTDELSDRGYYVKSVLEHPPRDSAPAEGLTRAWDISGRYYDGVYPVDFHLALTGTGVRRGDIRAHTGSTAVRLNVRGSYANTGLAAVIEYVWQRLHDLVTETLAHRSHAPPAGAPARGGESERDRQRDELLRRAENALLAGRISEQVYRDIKARLEQEFG